MLGMRLWEPHLASPPLMCPDIFCEIFSDDKSDTSTSGKGMCSQCPY